jgi:branched-chain amino acid transport system substrate-binding protein
MVDDGADMFIVSCDYDFAASAILAAVGAGLNSISLCAEDINAGTLGIGLKRFPTSILAAEQGATMAEWAVK